MKNLIIVLLIISLGTAVRADIEATTTDGKQIILKDDGTWHYKNKKPEATFQVEWDKADFLAEDGYGKQVLVKFTHDEESKKAIPPKELQTLVMSAVIRSKFSANNQLSYLPIKATIFRSKEDGHLVVIVKWRAKNAYGAEGEEHSYFKIDQNFKLKKLGE